MWPLSEQSDRNACGILTSVTTQCSHWSTWGSLQWASEFIKLLGNIIKIHTEKSRLKAICNTVQFQPRNNIQAVGTKMSMSSQFKHGKPLTKQPKQISLEQKANYTRNWDDFPFITICLYTGVTYFVCVSHDLSLYSLGSVSGEETDKIVQRSKNRTCA